jgi:4-amino-4-deoxy-L-arabinose transferase-like glycosyltransferase
MTGVLTIAVAYLLGRVLFGIRVGLLSALLLALSPLHTYYSKELRMYVPMALLTSLALFFLYKATKRGRWSHWVGYAICAALAFYTHYYAVLTFIAVSLFLGIRSLVLRDWPQLRSLALGNMLAILLLAPWLPTFVNQVGHDPVKWIPARTWEDLVRIFTEFHIHYLVLESWFPVFALILATVLVVGLVNLIRARNPRTSPEFWSRYLYIVSCVIGPIAIAIGLSFFKPLIVDRYFLMVALPACIVLAVSILQSLQHHWMLPAVLLLFAGMLISSCGMASNRWKEDWRGVAAYLEDHAEPHHVVVLGSFLHEFMYDHYYDGPQQQYSIPTDSARKNEIAEEIGSLQPYDHLWLVIADRFYVNHELVDEVVDQHTTHLESCQEFGGYFKANVCLYAYEAGSR